MPPVRHMGLKEKLELNRKEYLKKESPELNVKKNSEKELSEFNRRIALEKKCRCTCESHPYQKAIKDVAVLIKKGEDKSPGWKGKNYKRLLDYIDIVQEIHGKPSCLADTDEDEDEDEAAMIARIFA